MIFILRWQWIGCFNNCERKFLAIMITKYATERPWTSLSLVVQPEDVCMSWFQCYISGNKGFSVLSTNLNKCHVVIPIKCIKYKLFPQTTAWDAAHIFLLLWVHCVWVYVVFIGVHPFLLPCLMTMYYFSRLCGHVCAAYSLPKGGSQDENRAHLHWWRWLRSWGGHEWMWPWRKEALLFCYVANKPSFRCPDRAAASWTAICADLTSSTLKPLIRDWSKSLHSEKL